MIVRFKVKCRAEKTEEAMAAFQEVVRASRAVDGVVSFDIGHDVVDRDAFVAVEVFEDRAALDRQEALPATQKAMGLLGELVAAEPEATIYHVSASEPLG